MTFEKLTGKRLFLALPLAVTLLVAGCGKSDTGAASKPEPGDVAQTEDVSSEPAAPDAPSSDAAKPDAPTSDAVTPDAFTPEPAKPDSSTPDPSKVVVRVNGTDITEGEIQEQVKAALQQYAGRVPPEQIQQLQQHVYTQVKDDLIVKKLLDAAVAAANMEVTDAEVSEAITLIKSKIPAGMNFATLLAAQGMTEAQLTEDIKGTLATRKFLESKVGDVGKVTEEEAKKFYDENQDRFNKPASVTASHILIKVDQDATDEAKAAKKAQLEKIRADIVAKTTTFEDAARENSECPSKAEGGSLGTFSKGQMVPAFEDAAFAQKVGEVGGIVESPFGYHIIKVSDQQKEGIVPFEEAKEQIVSFLGDQKKQQAAEDYVKGLRDSAKIEEVGTETKEK